MIPIHAIFSQVIAEACDDLNMQGWFEVELDPRGENSALVRDLCDVPAEVGIELLQTVAFSDSVYHSPHGLIMAAIPTSGQFIMTVAVPFERDGSISVNDDGEAMWYGVETFDVGAARESEKFTHDMGDWLEY